MYGTSYVKKYLSNKVYIFKSANTYKTENNITSNITNPFAIFIPISRIHIISPSFFKYSTKRIDKLFLLYESKLISCYYLDRNN